jgi:hypothetical protein
MASSKSFTNFNLMQNLSAKSQRRIQERMQQQNTKESLLEYRPIRSQPARTHASPVSNENIKEPLSRRGMAGRMRQAMKGMEQNTSFGDDEELANVTNPNDLLSTTISTIIMLAKDQQTSTDLTPLLLTEQYLECVQDENNQNPPNVKKFLKFLKFIIAQKSATLNESDRFEYSQFITPIAHVPPQRYQDIKSTPRHKLIASTPTQLKIGNFAANHLSPIAKDNDASITGPLFDSYELKKRDLGFSYLSD